MYTKYQFGMELKNKVIQKEDLIKIGAWAYSVFLDNCGMQDDNFLNMLLTLNTMELGPEFSFTYEELTKIADNLIAGRDVNI